MIENKFNTHQHALLSSIATARGFKYHQDDNNAVLESADFTTDDRHIIAKHLLGLTATLEDLSTIDSILNYIKKLPNYDQLVSEAREYLEKEGITLPNPSVIETFQPGTIGWMRQLIDICK